MAMLNNQMVPFAPWSHPIIHPKRRWQWCSHAIREQRGHRAAGHKFTTPKTMPQSRKLGKLKSGKIETIESIPSWKHCSSIFYLFWGCYKWAVCITYPLVSIALHRGWLILGQLRDSQTSCQYLRSPKFVVPDLIYISNICKHNITIYIYMHKHKHVHHIHIHLHINKISHTHSPIHITYTYTYTIIHLYIYIHTYTSKDLNSSSLPDVFFLAGAAADGPEDTALFEPCEFAYRG